MSKQIEVEGGELAIRNSNGDIAIIPKKYRLEVEGMLKDKCYNCIDKLVSSLPTLKDYAEEGTIIPDKIKSKKEEYYDNLVSKYGEEVNNRQVYIDMYTTPLRERKGETTRYDETRLPPENDPVRPYYNTYKKSKDILDSNFDAYMKGYYSPEELSKMTEEDKVKAKNSYAKRVEFNKNNYLNAPENKVKVVQESTTIKDILDKKKDIPNKALFYASLMDEGGDKFVAHDSTSNELLYDASKHFGLDTPGDKLEEFIKNKRIDPNIKDRLIHKEIINPKGEKVNSVMTTNLSDIIDLKNAYLTNGRNIIVNEAKKKNIKLDDEDLDYFMLATYNYGDTGATKMLDYYNEKGLLENKKYLSKEPEKYQQIHKNIVRRLKTAKMLKNENIIKD